MTIMNKSKTIAITGAGGQIGYALVFRVAAGELLAGGREGGQNHTTINLNLLEIPPALPALSGLKMELEDCAFPTLNKITCTASPEEAFADADMVFMVGSRPRGPGMERKDLLEGNAAIFSAQGKALNTSASPGVKVLVVGNPANTNALIAMHNAPNLSADNFSAMTRLDHNRTLAQLSIKSGVPVAKIKHAIIWGNHSATQYPDIHNCQIDGKSALSIVDDKWYKEEMIPAVQQRGATVIKARGSSSAASAANAALEAMRDWELGSPADDWVSMSICGGGNYDIEQDLFYSYPVQCSNGKVSIVQDIAINDFSRKMMVATEQELKEERDAVKHLLP